MRLDERIDAHRVTAYAAALCYGHTLHIRDDYSIGCASCGASMAECEHTPCPHKPEHLAFVVYNADADAVSAYVHPPVESIALAETFGRISAASLAANAKHNERLRAQRAADVQRAEQTERKRAMAEQEARAAFARLGIPWPTD